MRYKVGDRVRVRKDLVVGRMPCDDVVSDIMIGRMGKVGKIIDIKVDHTRYCKTDTQYVLDLPGDPYFCEHQIDLVKKGEKEKPDDFQIDLR